MRAKKRVYKEGDLIYDITFLSEIPNGKYRRCLFKCYCGKIWEASLYNILCKQVKSCGCRPKGNFSKVVRKKIKCACGCGIEMDDFDSRGRKSTYIHGHNKNNLGKRYKLTESAKNSMREKKKNNPPRSIESRRLSGSYHIGEKNNNWKGGVTKEYDKIRKSIDYREWRMSVFRRDNFTCMECGEKESVSGKLNAHHIKPFASFPELRLDVNNGITLCKSCHELTDTYLNRWYEYNKKSA